MDGGFVAGLLLGPVVTAVMAGIARAAATGRIRRNQLIGIRLPSTMASDAAWHAGHRAAVGPACWSLVVLLGADLGAVLLRAMGSSSESLTLGLIALMLIAIAWVAVAANRSARGTDS